MSYLIFPTAAAAQARSEAAYAAPEGARTSALWGCLVHPIDGRAALLIPETPDQAGIGISQAAYNALLTAEERAVLAAELTDDWQPAAL